MAETVHEIRKTRREGRKSPPDLEDTYFSILLPALALLSLSVLPHDAKSSDLCSAPRFKAWLGKLIHQHLDQG